MAKVNRFYSPSRSGYVSQFVPERLPENLMIAPLAAKQKTHDQMQGSLDALSSWDARALPGYDTMYKEAKRKELNDFIAKTSDKDLASGEFIREYKTFVRGFQQDEGLKKVQNSVATHDEFVKRQKKLKEGKGDQYDEAFVDQYNRRFLEYTAEDGLGFTGETSLGDPSILEGTDINKEFEGYFDQLKADGAETLRDLSEGLVYKNGWKGVRGDKVSNHHAQIFDLAYNSRAGEQLQARYKAANIPRGVTHTQFIQNLTPKERVEFDNKMREDVASKLLSVGQGYKWEQHTTNADTVINKKAGWDREDRAVVVQDPVIGLTSPTQKWNLGDWDQALTEYSSNEDNIRENQNKLDTYSRFLTQINTGQPQGASTADELRLLKGLPGSDKLINGATLTPRESADLKESLTYRIKATEREITGATVVNKRQEERMRNAVATTLKSPKYGEDNLSFQEAMELGDTMLADPDMHTYYRSAEKQMENAWVETKDAGAVKARMNKYLDVMVRKDIIRRQDSQQLSEAHATAMLHKLELMKNWANAEVDLDDTMKKGADNKNALKDNFNVNRDYTLRSSTMPVSKTYLPNIVDSEGNVSTTKLKTQRADFMMENLAQTGLSTYFDVFIGNREIKPGEEEYPTPSTIKFAGSVTEFLEESPKPMFVGRGTTSIVTIDKTTLVEEGEEPKKKSVKQELNYTFKAKGVKSDEYFTAKANEEYSNYIVNPSTPAGRRSYANYMYFMDRDLGTSVARVNKLNKDQSTYFNRELPLSAKGDETVTMKVTKDPNNEYLLKAVASVDGRNILPEKDYKFITVAELGDFILKLEKGLREQADNGYFPLTR